MSRDTCEQMIAWARLQSALRKIGDRVDTMGIRVEPRREKYPWWFSEFVTLEPLSEVSYESPPAAAAPAKTAEAPTGKSQEQGTAMNKAASGMTKREKILAITVGAMFLLVASVYLLNTAVTAFEERDVQLLRLQQEVTKKKREIFQGDRARKTLDAFLDRSLPPDRALAKSLYSSWLTDKANKAGLIAPQVTPPIGRAHQELYYQQPFVLNCEGDLPKLTRFLYAFYSADYLHRIRRLSAQPIDDNKRLKLTIMIDGLSLNDAPEQLKLAQREANRLKLGSVEEYLESIVARNVFAPANNPPRLASLRTQRGSANETLEFEVTARDPENHDVTYRLVESTLEKLRVNDRGEVSCTPNDEDVGDHEVTIEAIDSGVPPQSTIATYKISIEAGDPPPPPFDPATQAEVTGVTDNGNSIVWINVRPTGTLLKLKAGDRDRSLARSRVWSKKFRSPVDKPCFCWTTSGQSSSDSGRRSCPPILHYAESDALQSSGSPHVAAGPSAVA